LLMRKSVTQNRALTLRVQEMQQKKFDFGPSSAR
jgi:hypothetical protein